jgi:Asp-tRNA(Asn)/Glu-tRNA(Gln) amidotransferase A subunit family amidase
MTGPDTIPEDLLEAFRAYERALLANDLDALDGFFEPGECTMRGDDAGLLVGHDSISDFRSLRGGVGDRAIERIEYRPLADDIALIISVSRFRAGGQGLQTQVWTRSDGGWRISAAHVSPRPRAFDRAVWRVVGEPLVDATGDGPLAGLTVAVKDLFALEGHRIGAGNPTYLASARVEQETAPAVEALLRGGAVVRGIARTDEFAYSIAGDNAHYGTPPNGALPGALPGGSSSGPASAVAAGHADIGLSTDTAGSVRIPASYQGLWGLRTTHGSVSSRGLLPLAQTFDAPGWITRDGDTLHKVAETCLESSSELPRRFVVPQEALVAADPSTRDAFEEALSAFGERVERVAIGDLAAYQEPFRIVQAAEAWRNHGEWVLAHPGALGPAIAERFRIASTVTAAEETAARGALAPLRERVRALVDGAVLVLPTAPGPAPLRTSNAARIDAIRTATLRITTPVAIAGIPAVSAPLLTITTRRGTAPVGVCFTSRTGTDTALVRPARPAAPTRDNP